MADPASITLSSEREMIEAAARWYHEVSCPKYDWDAQDASMRQQWCNAVSPGVRAMLALNRVDSAIASAKQRAALAHPARAQERCHRDNGPCYVGEGDDAHWRCGTSQCGTRRPASTQAGVAELVAQWRVELKRLATEAAIHVESSPLQTDVHTKYALRKLFAFIAADALAALGGEDG